jgi:hypothetical protein
LESKELEEFLLTRAMEHDSPTLVFRLACEYLISARMIRPGPVKRVAHARDVFVPGSRRYADGCLPAHCRAMDAAVCRLVGKPATSLVPDPRHNAVIA